MSDWSRVKWSEARQVLDILGSAEAAADAALAAPKAYFEQLRQAGELDAAARFLSQALPRLECVAWSARAVRDLLPPAASGSGPEGRALRAALLWIGDPGEHRRRAAWEAARAASSVSPEHFAARAVFFSGGSIAPANCPAVMPSRDTAGRFAAVAVISAANRLPDRKAALNLALDAGAAIAAQGLEAMST